METTSLTKPKVTNEHIMAIWVRHKANPQDATRNALVENYLPVVRYQAERMKIKLPDEVCVDDLMSAGVFGLIDAIKSYDPARRVKFETFAPLRIHGAIVDSLRENDWVPRLCRARAKKLEKATAAIRNRTGAVHVTPADVRAELGLSDDAVAKLIADGTTRHLSSLSAVAGTNDAGADVEFGDLESPPAPGDGPDAIADRSDWWAWLARGLTRAEQAIVTLYYRDGMVMSEIGRTLGLSESRVGQMHSNVVERLKAKLTGEEANWS